MFFNYLLTMVRNVRRDLGYTFINITGLAVGLACFILLALYLESEFSYDRHYRGHENIYRMVQDRTTAGETNRLALTSRFVPELLKEEYPEVIDFVRFLPGNQSGRYVLRNGDTTYYWENVYLAEENVFQVFPLNVIYGDPVNGLKDPNSIAISASVARAHFGDTNPVGAVLESDTANYTVTIVYEDVPDNTHLKHNALISYNRLLSFVDRDNLNIAQTSWMTADFVYLQMQPGYRPENFASISNAYYDKYMAERGNEINQRTEFLLEPLTDIHLNSRSQRDLPRGNRFYLYTFAAIGIMVLLVAIINYVNLATVRSAQRAKEIGMRKVMGAVKPQLVRQFMAESFLFVGMATLTASLLVSFAINYTDIEILLATDLSFNVLDRPELIVALLLLVVVVGFVSGAYPAFYLSSIQPVGAFRSSKGSGLTAVIRQGLVFVQFAISVGVIISALVMAAQMRYMQSRPLGFDPENLIIATLRGADTLARIPFIRNDLTLDSRVVSVADAPTVPGVNIESWSGQVESEQGNRQMVNMSLMYINEGYLDTLEIDVLEGRDLSPAIDDPHQGLVNETFVRNMGWTDAVGKQITYPNQPEHIDTIIGVVEDFHFQSLHQEIEPVAMFLGFNGWSNIENELQRAQATSSLAIRIDGNAGASALTYLQDKFSQYDPAHPFEYRFMTDILAELYLSERRQVIIIGMIAGLCILISSLGLFGLSAFNTSRRARELSIRRVLGATPGNLVLLLFRNTVGLIVAASVMASLIAYLALNSWLNNFNYRESAISHWEYFILAALAAVLIAFLTQTAQSWKTVTSNPSTRLRVD